MSFCPSCGAPNADDARFCNRCGTAIAKDAVPPPTGNTNAGPAPTNTGGTVTLGGIGIQSPTKTYAILAIGAFAFLGLGAGIAWVGMHGGAAAPATTTVATEDGAGSGDAIPDGVDVPDDEFVMSGGRIVRRPSDGTSATPSGGTSSGSGGTTTAGSGSTPPPTTTTTTGGSGSRPTTGGSGSRPTTGGSGSRPTTGGTSSGTSGSTATDPPPTSTTGGGSPPPTTQPDWDSMQDTVADPGSEPDYEMDMYETRLRRFIRQNLLPQSTSCFEHASAVSRDPIHGTVLVSFQIDARGHAQSATLDRNTTGNDALGRCLQNNVNTWQLPPPPAGTAPIAMQLPFTR